MFNTPRIRYALAIGGAVGALASLITFGKPIWNTVMAGTFFLLAAHFFLLAGKSLHAEGNEPATLGWKLNEDARSRGFLVLWLLLLISGLNVAS